MPQKSLTIIYIPGLGGSSDGFRQFALGLWLSKHWDVQFVPMNWNDTTESFASKKARVHDAIAQAADPVVLIGESAGAAMGLVVAHENKDVKLVTLCGKIGGAESTGRKYYDAVPAFSEILPLADAIRLDMSTAMRERITTVRAYRDMFLSLRDTTLPGVKQIVLPSIGHTPTIVLAITIFRYGIFRAVKQLTSA